MWKCGMEGGRRIGSGAGVEAGRRVGRIKTAEAKKEGRSGIAEAREDGAEVRLWGRVVVKVWV